MRILRSLNPCCSGQWSRTDEAWKQMQTRQEVLILVVVDNGLVQLTKLQQLTTLVLILVVVDNGLVLHSLMAKSTSSLS